MPEKKEPDVIAPNSGLFAAQLGSFRTNDQVQAAWERYRGKFSSEVESLKAVKSTFFGDC